MMCRALECTGSSHAFSPQSLHAEGLVCTALSPNPLLLPKLTNHFNKYNLPFLAPADKINAEVERGQRQRFIFQFAKHLVLNLNLDKQQKKPEIKVPVGNKTLIRAVPHTYNSSTCSG